MKVALSILLRKFWCKFTKHRFSETEVWPIWFCVRCDNFFDHYASPPGRANLVIYKSMDDMSFYHIARYKSADIDEYTGQRYLTKDPHEATLPA